MDSGPLKWPGGKTYLAARHQALAPPIGSYTTRNTAYVGGWGESWGWPHEGIAEVINDKNRALTNFWRVLQSPTAFTEFQRIVVAIPFSEVEWDEAGLAEQAPSDPQVADVDAAIAFFIRYRQSHMGLGKGFATLTKARTRRGMNEQASAWLSAIDGLPAAHERLRRVVILNMDALDFIRQQDSPTALFYLDPPYLHEKRVSKDLYEHEMTWDDHALLLELLFSIKGKFMLCGYRSELYDLWAGDAGWTRHEIEIDNKMSGKKEKEVKIECLYTNYSTAS